MSHTFGVLDLKRDGETSMTQQLVEHIAQLVDSGELEPGSKLPATRALAADFGINHLTAVRVYRRLAELGYVSAAVGRGTFVRRNVPAAAGSPADDDWQLGMLVPRTLSYADEMMRDSLHAPHAGDTIPLASGFPDPELCPSQELAEIAAQIARDTPGAVTDYLQVEGLPELRERIAELGRGAGYARSADEILITSGARQALDLVARAIVGPGDVAVVESPTFAGALSSLQTTGASPATRSSSSHCRRRARTRPARACRRSAATSSSSSRARAGSSSSTTASTRRSASTARRCGGYASRRRRT
jgi:DNA-binding transcriptional MocR family regulator